MHANEVADVCMAEVQQSVCAQNDACPRCSKVWLYASQ